MSAEAIAEAAPDPVPKYVCLSHCWGPPQRRPHCTTKENLNDHLTAIPWDKLPQTFKDVIQLCTELGIQYVWIDSLCIVQNDHPGWEREAKKMGEVYENAVFTIAASSAQDSSFGLFGGREYLQLVFLPRDPGGTDNDEVYAYIQPDGVGISVCLPRKQRSVLGARGHFSILPWGLLLR